MKLPSVKGILGSDSLNLLNAEIDFEKQRLFLKNHNEGIPFLLPNSNDYIPFLVVCINIQGKEYAMIVDTGASQTAFDDNVAEQLFPSNEYQWIENAAPSIGISASDILSETIDDLISIEEKEPFWNITFRAFKMENINKAYERLQIFPINAILGCDFLQKYKAVISFPQKLLYLSS